MTAFNTQAGGLLDADTIARRLNALETGSGLAPNVPVLFAAGSSALPGIAFAGNPSWGIYLDSGRGNIGVSIGATPVFAVQYSTFRGISVSAGSGFGFSSDATIGVPDVTLFRDAANVLAQRNNANAQSFNIYNTYTDASNYERGIFDWSTTANTLTIGTVKAGTGTLRQIILSCGTNLVVNTDGTGRLVMDSGGIAPYATGTYNLGNPTLAWKRLYIDYTNSGTVGAVTINKAAGRCNIAAAGSSVVVTNNYVTAASKVFAVVAQADATAYIRNVVPAAGSFTITLGAAATAQVAIDFFVVNTD